MKKTPVLEPVYWLAWRNNLHICEKGGMYFISYFSFFLFLYDMQHLVSGPPSHRDIFPSLVVRARRGRVQMPGDAHLYFHSTVCRWRGLELEKGLQRENTFSCVPVYHGGGLRLDLAALKLRASLAVQTKEQAWLCAVAPLSEFDITGGLTARAGRQPAWWVHHPLTLPASTGSIFCLPPKS